MLKLFLWSYCMVESILMMILIELLGRLPGGVQRKEVDQLLFLVKKYMKNVARWPQYVLRGTLSSKTPPRGPKNTKNPQTAVPFGSHFGVMFGYFWMSFLDSFFEALFRPPGPPQRSIVANLAPKRVRNGAQNGAPATRADP